MIKRILKGTLSISLAALETMAEGSEKSDREAGDERTVKYWLKQNKSVVYQRESYIDYDEDPEGLLKEKIIFQGAYDTKQEARRNASVYDTVE
ncbi:MAG: hypothetical protein WBM86_17605 [Waterburya sp.]